MVVIGFCSLSILLLAIAYVGFAQPILDDWCFAVNSLPPIERANDLYMTWTGRWPTTALLASLLRGQAVAGANYWLLAALGLPVWFGAFLIVADRAMEQSRWPAKIFAAVVLLATFWSTALGTGETFYWVAGYVGYGIPFLLGAGCLSAASRSTILACGLGFLSAAMNELGGIVLIVSLAGLSAHRFLERRSFIPTLAIMTAAAIGTALVIFSPGNAVRGLDQQVMSWPKIAWTVIRPYESALSIIADPRGLALVAATLAVPNPDRRIPTRWWLVPATAIVAAYVAVLAVAVGTGTAPGYRVLSFIQAGILGSFFYAAWQLRGLVASIRTAIHLAFAAVLVTGPAVGSALHDLPMAVGQWNPAHRDRWNLLQAERGRDVTLPDYAQYLSIYPDREIATDPNAPVNRCIATYFGLRSIHTVGADGRRWH
ncbi:MAG: hypothetical protein H0W65_08580 [Sphingomonas sp.]|nr:hypothetical protein [Sphingomonas sp.]